jgi:hypothetical protein
MNKKANIMATAAILTAVALPGIASAQHESQSSAANNATLAILKVADGCILGIPKSAEK